MQEPGAFFAVETRFEPNTFIIATAKLNGLAVVTTDENFEKYGHTVLS